MDNLYRKTIKIVIVCTSLLFQSQLYADEVIMYNDRPPSAEEMGNILFSSPIDNSEQTNPHTGIKLRSVSFGNKAHQAKPRSVLASEAATQSIGLPIQFSFNSTEILSKSIPFLDEVGKMMNLENYRDEKLLIEGHTDSSGPDQYNKILSKKRAQAVKNYLVDNFQISPEKLFVSGRGEDTPLPNTAPDAPANRRVQFYKAP